MKRTKDDDKDVKDAVANSGATVTNNNNSSKSKSNTSSSNNSCNNNNSSSNDANGDSGGGGNITPGNVRTTGRVKKPKLVYDPSDNYISRPPRISLPAPPPAPPPPPAPIQTQQTPSPVRNTSPVPSQQQPPQPAEAQITPETAVVIKTEPIENDKPSEAAPSQNADQNRLVDTCTKCGQNEPRRGSGYKSNFLACKACKLKWHFACIPNTFEILTNARKRYKCDKCRRCCICTVKSDIPADLLVCSDCANVYHQECHYSEVVPSRLGDPKWKCNFCDPGYNSNEKIEAAPKVDPPVPTAPLRKAKGTRKKRATSDPAATVVKAKKAKKKVTKNGNVAADKTPASKPIAMPKPFESALTKSPKQDKETTKASDACASAPKRLSEAESSPAPATVPIPTIVISSEDGPDGENEAAAMAITAAPAETQQSRVQAWSIDEVVTYFEKFYPRQADRFKDQEIDGAALMVLTRQDLIDRFDLKLGPALRIYELVLCLQTSSDDVTLAWCD